MNNLYKFLRCTVMMAVMIFIGSSTMWGQVPDGVYYITNTADPGNLPNPNTGGYDRWYLWPSVTTNSQTGKQYLTTFYDAQAPACNESGVSYEAYDNTYSHWVVKNLNDGSGRFQLINPKLNKYIVIRSKAEYGDRDVWLDDEPTGNEIVRSYFKLNGSSSPYLISPTINATTDIANATAYTAGTLTLNSAKGNKRYLCSTDNGQTPQNIDQRQGLLQFYDNAPTWTFTENKLPAPTISDVSATGTITITDANGLPAGYSIIYTTDGTEPTTATVTEYSDPIIVAENMTVKAIVVRYGIVLTHMAEKSVSPVIAPTITNNFDGTISLSTTTPSATIYYTTNGDTPDNTSTAYSSSFSLDDATVIKAIAYQGSSYSEVTIYNVPQYDAPTISFDNSTSLVTITSEGTVYYNTGNGTQDDPTPSSGTLYTEPFTVSSATKVKAIATHPGYLHSDVAIWPPIQGYLTFNVLTSGTICWKAIGTNSAKTIEYSINDGAWTSITAGSNVTISVNAGDEVRFKGLNSTYATDKSNYSGFDGGTATYDISGNIMSLIYGDNFEDQTTLLGTYSFCSLFKQSKAVSAENLILPATTLTEYCYRAMFSKCTTLVVAPALPATTLATGCYWYLFEDCAITTAPELLATTLVKECYGYMFKGCSNLNYIKCLATNISASKCLEGWVTNVSSSGTFVKKENVTWPTGDSGTPTGWYVVDEGTPDIPTISCDGFEIELSCTTTEAVIYYQLDHSGNYTQYTTPITITGDTFIECYSEKDGKTSATISQTCEYDDRTIYEYSNQSLDSWTYGGSTITTPYSVNAIDGHSSNYAKGTFNFETDVNLRGAQPTYLWFQHADQSATIYVDNDLVEKHWGGYNAFFVDITNHVHKGTNHIKVALKNNEGSVLAPYAGDFNFNATLGNVKLFTSPWMPSMSYGYDGFHITSTVSSAEATINVKTTIPTGATVVCTISGDNCNYAETKNSTGDELVFTTTIANPHLWNGTIDPYLYNVKLEIYHDNELYHSYERPYGLRFYEYVFNETVNGNPYTGFLLNGQPYLLRGVCIHDDLANKANALNDDDYTQEFNIITELGCNFLRLAHYPHPKEVYDKCDQLGIIVQTEAPWVNKSTIDETEDYWTHLEGQCADMVNQHYNHPCIMFWGVGNEINTSYTNTTEGKDFVKGKIEGYRNIIRTLLPGAMVGYTISHNTSDLLGVFNSPTVDWVGGNIYVGWYIQTDSNDPTNELDKRIAKTITNASVPCAFSEYGCGGTQSCHSEAPRTTTTRGTNQPRHDIEYQMWLHEGHIAAIKNKPELLFTSQWQLFDIAVWNRQEGYKVCFDGGETVFENNELKFLNNKGLVERDHKTKKDPFYLYKAWWNQTDKFVHICGKDYKKLTDRVIKCYTNDGIITDNDTILRLFVNDVVIDTATVVDNIATFEARDFSPGDVIRVEGATTNGATTNDTFTFTDYNNNNVFLTNGNWNEGANWSGNVVPTNGSDVVIMANATVPSGYTANADDIDLYGGSLTLADGGQLYHSNEGVMATVQKNITGRGNGGGWNFIASPVATVVPSTANGLLSGDYDLYYYHEGTHKWRNYKGSLDENHANPGFSLTNGKGYLYANTEATTLSFTGALGTLGEVALDFNTDEAAVLPGWNLVGNPFPCNVTSSLPYYLIDGSTNQLNGEPYQAGTIIPSCTGIMVKAEASDQSVTFTKVVAQQSNLPSGLQIAVAQANTRTNTAVDKAIVSFSEGNQLEKFIFDADLSKLYIPQDGKDYAIITAETQGEIPVNFRAAENGPYTITVSPENVEMGYLHLIDNMTGADVDLLAGQLVPEPVEGPGVSTSSTTSYTFNAKTTDYVSRFKLVFSVNDEDGPSTGSGTFAFYSNGNIIINGKGTVQLIDMTGRIIVSVDGHTRCIPTAGMTPGVYVLRLIDGNDVKTQKIVVR